MMWKEVEEPLGCQGDGRPWGFVLNDGGGHSVGEISEEFGKVVDARRRGPWSVWVWWVWWCGG